MKIGYRMSRETDQNSGEQNAILLQLENEWKLSRARHFKVFLKIKIVL